jgi:hypothetical protein
MEPRKIDEQDIIQALPPGRCRYISGEWNSHVSGCESRSLCMQRGIHTLGGESRSCAAVFSMPIGFGDAAALLSQLAFLKRYQASACGCKVTTMATVSSVVASQSKACSPVTRRESGS